MIKHFCDICGRELNSKVVYKNSDPDDYTFGGIEIDTGFRIITLGVVCNGCAKKIQKITEDDVMDFIKEKMKEK